jgi:hypothetical protein
MVTIVEMHKKMIKTVLDKLPPFIENYPPEEKGLLNDFMKLMKDFEQAEVKRTELIKNYELYSQKLLGSKKYLHTPFLWFTDAYFQKAKLTLNWDNYQAEAYYEYLAKFLRVDKSYQGVFELIRKQTPLSDGKWEQLQYACSKMLKPITAEEMKIIKGLISLIKYQGIYSIDPERIKKQTQSLFPKGTKVNRLLSAFLTNLECKWYINFHSPAFGIEHLFFHLKGVKSKLDEIIPFQDPNNTVLGMSDIYVSKEKSNEYFGIFYLPTQDVKAFNAFLLDHETNGKLKIKELSHIKTSRRGFSLDRYIVDKGWSVISKADLRNFSHLLRTENEEQAQLGTTTIICYPKTDEKWLFTQHQLPHDLINVYCNIDSTYLFPELPTTSTSKKREKNSIKTNIGLLKQLIHNDLVCIYWIPWRLVYEYSLDSYWVKLPKSFFKNLIHLMKITPVSNVNIGEENIYIWAHLTPQMVEWLKKDLKFKVYPIVRYFSPCSPDINWFNQKKLLWKTPSVLKSSNG